MLKFQYSGVGVEDHFGVQMVLHSLVQRGWCPNYALKLGLEQEVDMGVVAFVTFEYLCWKRSCFD